MSEDPGAQSKWSFRDDVIEEFHPISEGQVALVVDTLTQAFQVDPVWVWALPDERSRAHLFSELWTVFVRIGVRNGWVWSAPAGAAVSLWDPPGVIDLDPGSEEQLFELTTSKFADGGARIQSVLECFSSHRPSGTEHFYLNMIGVRDSHRGRGIGMALLKHNLTLIDETGGSAYLESSNPRNLRLYQTLGFEVLESFALPAGGPTVTTMWRHPALND